MALPTARTWLTGEDITAARLNTISDHLEALDSFAALITQEPVTSGTSMYLKVTRPTSTSQVLEGWVSGESFPRIRIRPQGIGFGDGSANPGNFLETIDIGGGALEVRMFGNFGAEQMRITDQALLLDATPSAAALAYIQLPLLSANTIQPAAGTARLYLVVSAGQTRLRVQFANGTVVDLAAAGAAV